MYAYFTSFGGFMALTSYFPVYFKTYHKVEAQTAGFLTAAYSISASVIRSISGPFTDKFGGDKCTILGMSLIVIGSACMGFSPRLEATSPFNVIGMIFMAIGGGIGNAGVFKWIPVVNQKSVGAVGGLVSGFGATGGFFIPLILGAIAFETKEEKAAKGYLPTERYAQGFFFFTGISLLAVISEVILYMIVKKRKAKEAEEAKKNPPVAVAPPVIVEESLENEPYVPTEEKPEIPQYQVNKL